MKRLFQFVVFGLALLAAVEPLLADTACVQPQCEGSPVRSVCFDGMAIPSLAVQNLLASSQATPQAVSAAGCCRLRSDGTASLVATPPIFRLANDSAFLVPVAQLSASPAVILASRSSEDAAAGAVSRNILFQVFRI